MKMEIAGVHTKLTKDIEMYVHKRLGELDKYVPKNARGSLHAEVKLKESKAKNKTGHVCEVIMHLPHERVTTIAKATTMLAAIDEAEAKQKNQLKKYKEKHGGPRLHRRVLRLVKRS